MSASPREPTAETGRARSARRPLPRRAPGPSAIAEAVAASGARNAGDPAAADHRQGDQPGGDPVPPMSAAAAEFAALTAEPAGPRPPALTPAPAQDATPPRRSRKALLAGAVVLVGALAVGVPFLVRGGGDDGSATSAQAAGRTALGEGQDTGAPDAPGAASPTPPTGSATPSASAPPSASASASPSEAAAPVKSPAPGKGPGGMRAGVRILGAASGRCVEVTGGRTEERTPLQLAGCTGAARQTWRFLPDGTVRALGRCMDVDGGTDHDGSAIQLVSCNGTDAQRFRLDAAGDLVNVRTDKCVDVRDQATSAGARLQQWSCSGAPHQKWSTS
ncbi:ricin-type beta-trefoil lectin domain protein [Streptomyces sp. NPDC058417]|uniref:ricin-type beta-trefoil lectin domain protein n=1 Tax=unclassified Streptomyces TaxID=2593676 RepID=UPI0036689B62